MSWLKIEFDLLNGTAVEPFSELLDALGAVSVTMTDAGDQPILEPDPGATPLWDVVRVAALFPADSDPAAVLAGLREAGAPDPLPAHRVETLDDQDWERAWISRFQPMRFGERLWVRPSWSDMDPGADAVVLDLDPGLAFGTGTHETTALCLEWLDQARLDGWACIDYGCGSGILAIAALKLGARHVDATDIDPQALTATRSNALANQVADRLDLVAPAGLAVTGVDLLMANILAGPLHDLAAEFATRVRTGGRVLLSGILEQQAPALQSRYAEWFDMDTRWQRGDWILLAGVRRGATATPGQPAAGEPT